MAYTVGFGKLEHEVISNDRLPADVQEARIHFKNEIRAAYPDPEKTLVVFENGHHRYIVDDLSKGKKLHRFEQVLPKAGHGEVYYEYDVGQATVATARDPKARGERRLVARSGRRRQY